MAPGEWSLPVWLVLPPAALLVLILGMSGSFLSMRWASDSYNAAVIHQRLIAHALSSGKEKPLPESVTAPNPSWWLTTSLHLVHWGVYLGHAGTAEDQLEEARDMVNAAIRITPISSDLASGSSAA